MAPTAYRYFAYGSNMSSARLRQRAPSAQALGKARLADHALRWHKLGRDGSGKCDVVAREGRSVWGVLYELDRAEKAELDRAEGLGIGYFEMQVRVAAAWGDCVALTYQAKPNMVNAALRPRQWYKDHVLRGAREHGLPADYVAVLAKAPAEP